MMDEDDDSTLIEMTGVILPGHNVMVPWTSFGVSVFSLCGFRGSRVQRVGSGDTSTSRLYMVVVVMCEGEQLQQDGGPFPLEVDAPVVHQEQANADRLPHVPRYISCALELILALMNFLTGYEPTVFGGASISVGFLHAVFPLLKFMLVLPKLMINRRSWRGRTTVAEEVGEGEQLQQGVTITLEVVGADDSLAARVWTWCPLLGPIAANAVNFLISKHSSGSWRFVFLISDAASSFVAVLVVRTLLFIRRTAAVAPDNWSYH